jgi:hypothetical protein
MNQENPVSIAVLDPEETGNRNLRINYYLTSKNYARDEWGVEEPHTGYGVEVQLFIGGRQADCCKVADISVSQDEVLALIEVLSRNTVTPVSLRDVIEDYLAV